MREPEGEMWVRFEFVDGGVLEVRFGELDGEPTALYRIVRDSVAVREAIRDFMRFAISRDYRRIARVRAKR